MKHNIARPTSTIFSLVLLLAGVAPVVRAQATGCSLSTLKGDLLRSRPGHNRCPTPWLPSPSVSVC